MRYPEFLKDGGRIGFIAPSFGCTTEPYHTLFGEALAKFGKAGYKTVLGPNCYAAEGVGKSNTPQACGAEVNEYFCNDHSDIIISCGGGETMCEDLPYIDFGAIAKAKPKWYMGYSDNTNLVLTLPTLCDTAAVYGPCASSYGVREPHEALNDAISLLRGEKLTMHNYEKWEIEELDEEDFLAPYNCTEDFCMRMFMGTEEKKELPEFSGRLLGGCLDCAVVLCGTRFDRVKEFNERYREDGTLWFLEACDLNPMGIRRSLWQLRNAGWFDTATGFLIGRALLFNDDYMGVNRINAVLDSIGDLGLPICIDVDLGHLPPMMPLISGAVADVAAGEGLEIRMRLE